MNHDVGEQHEVNETRVKKLVRQWLEAEGYTAFPEFEVEGGRLDFVGARWADGDRRLEIVGIECKGRPSAGEVWRITSEQLHRYARCVPRLYFACAVPASEEGDFGSLCKLAHVGFLRANDGPIEESIKPPAIGPRLDPTAYVGEVRAKIALRFAFGAVFGAAPDQVPIYGSNWISTPEKSHQVQWNAVLDAGRRTAYLGVNIENARKVLAGLDAKVFAGVLANLPSEAIIWANQENYLARRRSMIPLLETQANAVTEEEIVHLVELAPKERVHVTIGLPLWPQTETRHRAWYEKTLKARREALVPVREALLGLPA